MIHCDSGCWFRYFEEKLKELEELQNELQGHVEDLEEENEHLKKQNMMVNEAKIKLRQETSLLTAENMVSVCVCVYLQRVPKVVMAGTNVCLCYRT